MILIGIVIALLSNTTRILFQERKANLSEDTIETEDL